MGPLAAKARRERKAKSKFGLNSCPIPPFLLLHGFNPEIGRSFGKASVQGPGDVL
jgi:hypothetical protein